MKKSYFIGLSLFLFVSCFSSSVSGEAKTIERFAGQRIVGVDASSAFNVTISQGASSGATVEVPESLVDKLVFRLDDEGVVEVGFMGNTRIPSGTNLRLNVVCTSLEQIEIDGAVSAQIKGAVTTPRLEVNVEGAARLEANDLVDVASQLEIDGSAASSTKFSNLRAASVDIDASSACLVDMVGVVDRANIEASSAATVDCSQLEARESYCEASSSARISVRSSVATRGEVSSAATVDCYGAGTVDVRTSSAGSVNTKK